MDKKTLVEPEIEAGQALVHELERAGLPIASAMWVKRTEDVAWRFYVATPNVETYGPKSVYGLVDKVLRKKEIPSITVDDVSVSNTTNHFVNSIARALPSTRSLVTLGSSTFDDVHVDSAIVYKIVRGTRASKTSL